MRKFSVYFLFVFLHFLSSHSNAQTTLPSFFSNNMVIQQKTNVNFWGKDLPGKQIVISSSWGESSSAITGKDGKWMLKISTPQAGGPYSITVKGSNEIILSDVLVGEVWFCSGQSNMLLGLKSYSDRFGSGSNEEILHSDNDNLRVFQTKQNASLVPLDNVSGNWVISQPSTASSFGATAYFFGKLLQEILHVPVGLIISAWGGSPQEAWMSAQSLSGFKQIVLPEKLPDELAFKQPILLYNGMVHPFIPFSIKGAIWYQGEGNVVNPELYKDLLPTMIQAWRKDWGIGSFPFYFVQLAPYKLNNINSAFLREAQLNAMLNVENTGMAVALDIGDCSDIHPREKKVLGNRLAYWALSKTYNLKGIECSGPVYQSMSKLPEGKIELDFDQNGLTSFSNILTGFEIAGEDRIFYTADAVFSSKAPKNQSITVWNEKVKDPVAVRYCFKSCVEDASIFNEYGLPASSFRTDSWEK